MSENIQNVVLCVTKGHGLPNLQGFAKLEQLPKRTRSMYENSSEMI